MCAKKYKTMYAIITLSLLFAAGAFFSVKSFLKKSDWYGNVEVFQCSTTKQVVTNRVLPWDVAFELSVNGQSERYVLSDNIDGLSASDKEARLIFCSAKIKSHWVREAVEMGFDEVQAWCYLLPGLNDIVKRAEKNLFKQEHNATLTFTPDANRRFEYKKETVGARLDREALANSLRQAVFCGGEVKAQSVAVYPKITLDDLKKSTTLKSRFSTKYGGSTTARKSNIKKALGAFNGMIVEDGAKVSFNRVVGPRTKQNGFAEAKIIVDGKYVQGVGGGVCQASTTLFNALIEAGITINNVHQHSLASSYVAPSFDAMVSSASDLTFTNETGGAIYIVAYGAANEAVVEIYGLPNEFEIKRRSVEIAREPCNTRTIEDKEGKYADKVFFEDEVFVLTNGADGLTSEGWLDYYKNGKLIKSKKIRRNTYKSTDRVVVKGVNPRCDEKTADESD